MKIQTLWAGGLPLWLACSILYGDPPVGQCRTDADCAALRAVGYSCDPRRSVCVAPNASLPLGARPIERCELPDTASELECAAQACAAPLSSDCACLAGAWQDPDALVIGVIAPQTFAAESGKPVQIPYVPRWEKSIALALEEWGTELPQGRLQRSERSLAVLYCNSNDELFQARRAMTHLTDRAHAAAVITLTDNDTDSIRYQALRQNIPVLCSTCFSAPAPSAERSLSIWQVAPPLVDQAPLAAFRVDEAARSLRGADDSGAEPQTLVSLSQNYPGINEFVAELQRLLELRGTYRQIPIVTPDPRTDEVFQPALARSVIEARPRVIYVGMDSDFTTYYLRLIESGWPEGEPRPLYVLSYLNQELGLLAEIVGEDDGLRQRISGTGWLPDPAVASNLSGLEERFLARHGERLDQVQFGYDAFYATAYAAAWADSRGPLEGGGLLQGLAHLQAGPALDVAPGGIKSALALLTNQDINLTGSSNRLDWQTPGHATRSDATIWCLSRNAAGSLALTPSAGPIWHAESRDITGSYVCP